MIKVEKIEICEFRGIRELSIDFKGKSFGICGKNGTGKSGIVDALQFALTGNISRLSGEGTGGVSVKLHAPHVDSRNDPHKAKVILTVSIPGIEKNVVIERSVNNASQPLISCVDPQVITILDEISLHPEFTLSRRELIKYVVSTPGDRSAEVQALLRLDRIDELRAGLQKIANACKKEEIIINSEKVAAQKQLMAALDISELSISKLLEQVNVRRKILDLNELTAFTATTSIKDGLTSVLSDPKVAHITKTQALVEIAELKKIIGDISSENSVKILENISIRLTELIANPVAFKGMIQENLLRLAIDLVDDKICPVCDTEWDIEELKTLIGGKLKKFEISTAKRSEIEKDLKPFIEILLELETYLTYMETYGKLLKPTVVTTEISNFKSIIRKRKSDLQSFVNLEDVLLSVKEYTIFPETVVNLIEEIEKLIVQLPDSSKQDAARDYLTIGQERLEVYRTVSNRFKQSEEKSALSAKIFRIYGEVTTDFLNEIYKDVEKDFTDFYRFINSDDEGDFTAELKPSIGKLGFEVNFYGRGYFPPGAYHSEGHQDGMGLCLYLALMKHLLGNAFTFAVLDDVLMSVDSGHRREVCRLLKEYFPNTQFVLTTHDEVWLKHMKSAGLIFPESSKYFRKWDVDNGPNEWSDKDIWEEINSHLTINDVHAASSTLRHYLEYVTAEICYKLHAKVEFQGDGQYNLGHLLSPATSQMKQLLEEAKKAANTWGKKVEEDNIQSKLDALAALVSQSNLEQWPINAAIHYNEWANLDAKDFIPVVLVYKNLIKSFFCTDCRSLICVISQRSVKDSLKCSCGTINFNMKRKVAGVLFQD